MSKLSDKSLQSKLNTKLRQMNEESNNLEREISTKIESKFEQAEGQSLFFYGIVVGLFLNLIANIISKFFDNVSFFVYIIYVLIILALTMFVSIRTRKVFENIYLIPLRSLVKMLKRIENHKITINELKSELDKLKF